MAVIVGKDGKVRQFNIDRGSPPFIPDVRPSAIEQPPHLTDIMGQPHMLSYITPDEATLLMEQGGMGIEGPMGIPAFPPGDSGYGSGEGTGIGSGSGSNDDDDDDDDDGPGFDPSAPPDSGGYGPATPPSSGGNDDGPATPPSSGGNDDGPGFDPSAPPDSGGYGPPTPPSSGGNDDGPATPPSSGGNDDGPGFDPSAPPDSGGYGPPTPPPGTGGGGTRPPTKPDIPPVTDTDTTPGGIRPPKRPDIPPVTDTGGTDTGGTGGTDTGTDTDTTPGGIRPPKRPTKPAYEYGFDYNNDGNISYAERLRDMMDGGGAGKSGMLGGMGIIGAGLGLASNIGADIGMGYQTFGVGFDEMEQKLVDAGYSRKDAASYVQRTKDTMERNRKAAASGSRDDDDDSRFVAPPADPCPNGYIMDPESQVCVIDPVATPEKPKIPAPPPPPPPPPPLSEYIDYTPPVGGGGFLQPGSEDISFMRRSGQFAAGGQVGVGSLPAYSDFFRYK